MDILGKWILAVAATSLICGIVRSLTPEGGCRRAVEVVCAFAVTAAMLSVTGKLTETEIGRYVLRYSQEAQAAVEQGEQAAREQTRFIIEQRCETYIWDKAETLGVRLLDVRVTARWSQEGFWYPESCELRGDEDDRLSAAIRGELGITAENVSWGTTDEE